MRLTRHLLARALTWPLTPVLLAGTLASELARPGSTGAGISAADAPGVVALVACWLVGIVVTGRAPDQPAGWAFLGLGTAVAWSAFTDTYAEFLLASDGDTATYRLFATLGDSSFVWWFAFIALVLQLTPPPSARPAAARRLPGVTLAVAITFQVMALLRSTHLDPPFERLSSPLAVDALSGVTSALAAAAIYTLAACLIASVVELVVAWRRSEGAGRQQLLWLVAGAVPVAPCVIGAFVLSGADNNDAAAVLLSGAMVSIVAGAALSVLRYRLYDVERVVTDSAAYAIASASVIVAFVGVVVVISRSTPIEAGSQLSVVTATLAGVGVARVSYVWGRRAVGRRVNPARFAAVDVVRSGLAGPTEELDELMATVLGPHSRALYPAPGDTWVTSAGHAVELGEHGVDVHRHGALVARLEFDPAESDRDVVEAVAAEAAAELDNVALRAELARQLELIRESRTRLATAHLEERRRIERDLHDGAQQRLLAIALRLQSARLDRDAAALVVESDRAIADIQGTIQELRDLAAGLQPAALAGGGLLAAVADLAGRVPLAVSYDVVDERFPPVVEGAAWFVIAEAVTNAVKHSGADQLTVSVRRDHDALHVEIEDEGIGDADTAASGLQGLADRVGAAGGFLRVGEVHPHGTKVEAVLPCGS
ncbi:MAG TPA: histidine kinase [Nocardioidaceae bacterium]|nr:histidine kinase [Nocardioidaceae bacterium]